MRTIPNTGERMKLKNAFVGLDKLFKQWFEIDIIRESKYYSRRNKAEDIKDILYDMNIIDTKSNALLTHISIMFIVLGFFIHAEDNHWVILALLVLEFLAYLVTAMLLLRCVDIMGPPFRQPPESDEEIKQVYYFESTLRREIYARALRMAFILTVILFPIILLKYLL